MQHGSTLETIAEIGVSLAGFAGIVGALAGEKLRPTQPEVWLPFWVMISSGLGIVFAALFPFLPDGLGAPAHVSWAASSAFVTLVTASNVAFFSPRISRAIRAGTFRRFRGVSVTLNLSSAIVIVSQLLNTFGILLSQSAGGFLIGLYFLVLISGLNFLFLLYVLGGAPPARPAP